MKVSILMITYNHQDYIAEAIESVLMQEVTFDYELVIGDDASQDQTTEICKSYQAQYPDRIRLIANNENIGMMRNFIHVLDACDGEYIAILEGDDYWICPQKLQLQVSYLDSHDDCATCFTAAESCLDLDCEERTILPEPQFRSKARYSLDDILNGNFIPTCTVLFRANAISCIPPWFENLAMADWPLHLLVAQNGFIDYLNAVTSFYRVHTSNVYVGRPTAHKVLGEIGVYQRLLHFLDAEHRPQICKMMRWRYLFLARSKMRQSDVLGATQYMLQAVWLLLINYLKH